VSPEGTKRKLAAILSADVKGYSRLMGADEAGTIRTLTAYREAMARLIQEYRGRVVDAPGDNLLSEFASVVDAMRGAVEIQEELGFGTRSFRIIAGWSFASASTWGT
jgi:adenylate cyclase